MPIIEGFNSFECGHCGSIYDINKIEIYAVQTRFGDQIVCPYCWEQLRDKK